MPELKHGDATLYYETHGEGPALLLIAPGGMRSAISFWENTPWNPIDQLSDEFCVVAMDQRNAGRSVAPVTAADDWQTYTDDQLALMDHLGIDGFQVAGMCIGGPYCYGLIQSAPDRVRSATLFQPIGRDNNRDAFYAMFDDWAEPLKATKQAAEADWQAFRENMYGGDKVLFNVDEDFVSNCETPILLLKGNDLYHPASTSEMIAARAPNVTYIEEWKEGAARDQAMQQFAEFLRRHA